MTIPKPITGPATPRGDEADPTPQGIPAQTNAHSYDNITTERDPPPTTQDK